MDQQRLVALLQESQIPDTQRLKAATSELQKNFYPHPDSLLALIEIIATNGDANIRQQAAVQVTRLGSKHWPKVSPGYKTTARQSLLQATIQEQNPKCQHAISRAISTIGSLDLPGHEDKPAEWPELIPGLLTLASSSDVGQREVGSYILYCLMEDNPINLELQVAELLDLFAQTIRDPQSAAVRINTVLCIGTMLLIISPDDEPAHVDKLHLLIPGMVDVLKDAIQTKDDEKTWQAFEVFQSFLGYDSALLGKFLRDLILFMLNDLAANKASIEADVRAQALTFLNQAIFYRRTKILGMRDMGQQITARCAEILIEMDDDEDQTDELTPAGSAYELLNQVSQSLPPHQVINPLLDILPIYANSVDVPHRKAAMLGLCAVVNGSPDFIVTQLQSIMPHVIKLLHDPSEGVRLMALRGLAALAEELGERLAPYNEALLTGVVKNLQAAISTPASDEKTAKTNLDTLRRVCLAIDTMAESLTADFLKPYAAELVDNIGALLNHDDFKVKGAAMGALSAIAEALKAEFKPYFTKVMTAMGPYLTVKESEDDFALRCAVTDAAGRLAVAVGPESFQPYVMDIMRSTEEAMNLDNSSLKESTFIMWGHLAKVYQKDFTHFLPGVFKSLFASLELEEEEIALDLQEAGKDAVGTNEPIVTMGKKLKFRNKTEEDDINDMMDGDDDEEDWEDLASAEVMEKEVAIESVGDILESACGTNEIQGYLEKAVNMIAPLAEHTYEGCRRTAISTLWRAYQRVWRLMEEETGIKWAPGLPLKQPPQATLVRLGEIVSKATLSIWPEESEPSVLVKINSSIMTALKSCGPAILEQPDMLTETVEIVANLLNRTHPCQMDMGDEGEDHVNEDADTSENDWLVIDTALDVMIGLSAALGPSFAEIWPTFQKQVLKLASSNESFKRATAVGALGECTANMGPAITPFTGNILPILLKRLSDTNLETRSNSAYAVGQLISYSEDSAIYLPEYETILRKLEPMLQLEGERIKDNASGCLARMVMAHPDRVPLPDVLPALIGLLPLKEDFEENTPVYECIGKLCMAFSHPSQLRVMTLSAMMSLGSPFRRLTIYMTDEQNEPTIQRLTPEIIHVLEAVLADQPADQLTPETRTLVCRIIALLHGAKPDLFQGHEGTLRLAGMA